MSVWSADSEETSALNGLGANVLEVDHRRLSVSLPARSATLELTYEARNSRHGQQVVAALRQAGFELEVLPP